MRSVPSGFRRSSSCTFSTMQCVALWRRRSGLCPRDGPSVSEAPGRRGPSWTARLRLALAWEWVAAVCWSPRSVPLVAVNLDGLLILTHTALGLFKLNFFSLRKKIKNSPRAPSDYQKRPQACTRLVVGVLLCQPRRRGPACSAPPHLGHRGSSGLSTGKGGSQHCQPTGAGASGLEQQPVVEAEVSVSHGRSRTENIDRRRHLGDPLRA